MTDSSWITTDQDQNFFLHFSRKSGIRFFG
jgi:hypothetical protein